MMRQFLSACCATALICASASAQVVVDGTTSTTVVINPNGSVTVGIAPASGADGVSLNRYDDFNVAAPGVQLDNRTEAARTIVNEVTSTNQSVIAGPLDVLGQRAHVIVANPNGIVIDGGTFVNTGRVALTTGATGTMSRQIAPGIFQENVTSTVTGGRITVAGGGLSGQMDAVDLIAHDIRINGPVTNTNTNEGAALRLQAGRSVTEFNSAVVVGNTDLTWGSVTGGDETTDTLIAITRPGSLRANQIEIAVNDRGAGVAFAGDGFAGSRGFSLSNDGLISITGAQIDSDGGVFVAGETISATDSSLTATDSVIRFIADVGELSGSRLTTSSAQTIFQTEAALALTESQITTTSSDIILDANGSVNLEGGTLEAFGSLIASSTADLSFDGATLGAGGVLQLDAAGQFVANEAIATAFAHVLVTADQVTLERSDLIAENGSLILTTLGNTSDGSVFNRAGVLQGGLQTDGLANTAGTTADGAVTLDIAGAITNETSDDLGIVFGAGGDVVLSSGGTITNTRGRIVANGDVSLTAAGDFVNLTTGGQSRPTITEYDRKGDRVWWTLWLKQQRESGLIYDYGTVQDPDELAAVTAGGSVTIQANDITNRGGQINANGGDLSLTGVNITTAGLGSGRVSIDKACTFACDVAAKGRVAFLGGALNAADDVVIDASDSFTNLAGQVYALQDVTITAPDVTFEAGQLPLAVNRPSGLYNFWASGAAWIILRDQFGNTIADNGTLTVNSDQALRQIGTTIIGGAGVVLTAGADIVRVPQQINRLRNDTIGWFANFAPLKN